MHSIITISFLFLGIFEVFCHSETFTPDSDVVFVLRTKANLLEEEEAFQFVNLTKEAIDNSSYDKSKVTTFLVHGFTEDRTVKHHIALSKAILDAQDQNLFFVDWGIGAKSLNYNKVRPRVTDVAKVLKNFINFLRKNSDLKMNDVTLIGFSLGAHIVGLAGKKFEKSPVPRVIGIDPAGPLFKVDEPDGRLSRESAKYTECIHTGYFLGIKEPICHVDFYVNGGRNQPGCDKNFDVYCSHVRGVEVLTETFNTPKTFYGKSCKSYKNAITGDCTGETGAFINDLDNQAQNLEGVFYVSTKDKSPYGKGKE